MARKEIRPIRARKSKTALADIKVNNFIKRISVFNNSILAYNADIANAVFNISYNVRRFWKHCLKISDRKNKASAFIFKFACIKPHFFEKWDWWFFKPAFSQRYANRSVNINFLSHNVAKRININTEADSRSVKPKLAYKIIISAAWNDGKTAALRIATKNNACIIITSVYKTEVNGDIIAKPHIAKLFINVS